MRELRGNAFYLRREGTCSDQGRRYNKKRIKNLLFKENRKYNR